MPISSSLRSLAPSLRLFPAFLAIACAPAPPPPAPLYDAGPVDASPCPECPDTGPIVIRHDAGQDTGPAVDANVDAPGVDAAGADAGGALAITVDGALTDTAWMAQTPLVAAIGQLDPFGGDHLDTLYYFRDDTYLYLAFEGELVTGDDVVVYVDLGTTPSDVSLMGGLGDTSGAVDTTLSIPIYGSTEFQPELGWGTASMPHVLSAGADTIGWRALASAGGFALITASARSACSATACETAIGLATIGATSTSTINLVVRLGRPGVGWSNQTFPTSHSGTPENIDFGIPVPAAP